MRRVELSHTCKWEPLQPRGFRLKVRLSLDELSESEVLPAKMGWDRWITQQHATHTNIRNKLVCIARITLEPFYRAERSLNKFSCSANKICLETHSMLHILKRPKQMALRGPFSTRNMLQTHNIQERLTSLLNFPDNQRLIAAYFWQEPLSWHAMAHCLWLPHISAFLNILLRIPPFGSVSHFVAK